MLKTRVIPCLLLDGSSLVKTERFRNPKYIGDPANTLRIFNELEVDEIFILDIRAARGEEPRYDVLQECVDECFMPLAYGGGVRDVAQAKRLIGMGMEKVVVNSAASRNPSLVRELADHFGSQAVVGSIDVKKKLFGGYDVMIDGGRTSTGRDPVEYAVELRRQGAGEILVTSIDREGTWSGFDLPLVKKISERLDVPVIAHGGGGSIADIREAVRTGGASAVALGSMLVFQKKGLGVLVNFPERAELEKALDPGENPV